MILYGEDLLCVDTWLVTGNNSFAGWPFLYTMYQMYNAYMNTRQRVWIGKNLWSAAPFWNIVQNLYTCVNIHTYSDIDFRTTHRSHQHADIQPSECWSPVPQIMLKYPRLWKLIFDQSCARCLQCSIYECHRIWNMTKYKSSQTLIK